MILIMKLKVIIFSPTDAPRRKISEGSHLEDMTRKPRILDLLNIPPNPKPAAKMNPVINPMIISSLSSFSLIKRIIKVVSERHSKIFAIKL